MRRARRPLARRFSGQSSDCGVFLASCVHVAGAVVWFVHSVLAYHNPWRYPCHVTFTLLKCIPRSCSRRYF